MEVVAYFVDGAVFGLYERAGGGECVFGIYQLRRPMLDVLFVIPSSKKKRTLSPLSRK